MPTETFLRLPDEKRTKFVDAALAEFADHPYDAASLTRLVATLGIAKGSVYQYFEDKFDLFSWLLHEAAQRKRAHLAAVPEGGDLLERLTSAYAAGLSWYAAEPRWARLGLRALEPSAEPRLAAWRQAQDAAAEAYLRTLLAPRDAGFVPLVKVLLTEGLLACFFAELGVRRPEELDGAGRSDAQVHAAATAASARVLALLREGLPPAEPR